MARLMQRVLRQDFDIKIDQNYSSQVLRQAKLKERSDGKNRIWRKKQRKMDSKV